MKKLLFILPLLLTLHFCVGQKYFNKLLDCGVGSGASVELSDGYLILGFKRYASYNEQVLIKTTLIGDTIWSLQLGSYPNITVGSFKILLKDSFAIVSGVIYDVSNPAIGNFYIQAINLNKRTIEWSKRYGGSGGEALRDIIKVNTGFFLVGSTGSYSQSVDIYLLKLDFNGNKQWDKVYGSPSKYDQIFTIFQDNNGDLIMGGNSASYNTNGFEDALIMKTDTLGNLIWRKTYPINSDSWAAFICPLNNGNIFAGSGQTDAFGVNSIRTFITDAKGIKLKEKKYSIKLRANFNYSCPIKTSDGGIVMSGILRDSSVGAAWDLGFLIKFDQNLDTVWNRIYYPNKSAPNTIYNVIPTSDGGFLCTGSAFDSTVTQKVWIIKTDCLGADSIHYYFPNEAKCCNLYATHYNYYSPAALCKGNTLQLSIDSSFTSYLWNTGDASASISTSAPGKYSVKISNNAGCTLQLDTVYVFNDSVQAKITQQGNLLKSNYKSGNQWYFNGSAITGTTDSTYLATANGTYSLVVTNYHGCTDSVSINVIINSIDPNLSNDDFYLSPNPASERTTLHYHFEPSSCLQLFDIRGQKLMQLPLTSAQEELIDLSGLPAGIYFYSLKGKNTSTRLKKLILNK